MIPVDVSDLKTWPEPQSPDNECSKLLVVLILNSYCRVNREHQFQPFSSSSRSEVDLSESMSILSARWSLEALHVLMTWGATGTEETEFLLDCPCHG